MNDPDEPESGDELVTDYISGDEASLEFVDAMTPEKRARFEERIDAAFADPPRSGDPEKRPCPICTAFSHPHSPDCPRSGLSNGGNPYRALHACMSPPAAAWDEGFLCGLEWSSRRMSEMRSPASAYAEVLRAIEEDSAASESHVEKAPQLLRPSEVAEILGVTTRTVRALAERGELVKVKLGRRSARYQLADVERFIERHVVTPDNSETDLRARERAEQP